MNTSNKNLKVIVSCSGKFHAFALAEQLNRKGVLSSLYTSYSSIKNPLFIRFAKRIDKEVIPKQKIQSNLFIAIGIKLYNNPHFWNDLFDRWIAFKIKNSDANVFIGWSGMSLRSLRAAKKKGMITILERGSSHIEFQDELLKEEYNKAGLSFFINTKVKEKECIEYDASDYISIPSGFVKDSFIEKGINENKLIKNNYGSAFKKPPHLNKKDQKFRILYLGTSKIRKGLIYLYKALNELNIEESKFEVWFIGSVNQELKLEIEKFKKKNWFFHGHISQHKLPEMIAQCDVAIHPSIEEGLSMVIPQIMSCGVPVISTFNTGGADIIEDGVNGYLVPIRSPQSIQEKIEHLYQNPEVLREMKNATQTNRDFSWDAYGERYINNINKLKHG